MKIGTILGIAVALMALSSTDSFAGKRADRRQHNQQKRIQQGNQSGQLTQGEANALQKGQAHVDRVEDRAMADGKMTLREKRRLEKAQDHQSKKIYRLKHNGRKGEGASDAAQPAGEQPAAQ